MARLTKFNVLHSWTGRIQSIESLILNIAAGGWSKQENAEDCRRILFECERLALEVKQYQEQLLNSKKEQA